ncbi:CLUMA_CG006015, isoform A [Clunio marinus]|uniref:CLUMA_CG006015, isoform A n=1 Tax=Clunio marinus TaxID=568069 RepID=A0A1J1HY17_9DIPT|nr:CLUMA_CG006015, isoform A [Clunio marinus]
MSLNKALSVFNTYCHRVKSTRFNLSYITHIELLLATVHPSHDFSPTRFFILLVFFFQFEVKLLIFRKP